MLSVLFRQFCTWNAQINPVVCYLYTVDVLKWIKCQFMRRCYLDSSQIMWVEYRSLIEFHLSEVTFEQGFQLKIRGNTRIKKRGRIKSALSDDKEDSQWTFFISAPVVALDRNTAMFPNTPPIFRQAENAANPWARLVISGRYMKATQTIHAVPSGSTSDAEMYSSPLTNKHQKQPTLEQLKLVDVLPNNAQPLYLVGNESH